MLGPFIYNLLLCSLLILLAGWIVDLLRASRPVDPEVASARQDGPHDAFDRWTTAVTVTDGSRRAAAARLLPSRTSRI